jgi:hypothetical protein
MSTKIRAGRYVAKNEHGTYTVKKIASNKWIVLNESSRMVGDSFTTLHAAEQWIGELSFRPATNKSKSYLRSLLTSMAGDPFAERVRASLNERAARGEALTQSLVSLAIRHLLYPAERPSVPVQPAVKPFANRAEAIQFARDAVSNARG